MVHPLLAAIKPALYNNDHSAQDMADKLGVSKTQVSYILNGHSQVSVAQLEKLCEMAGYELIVKVK